MMFRLLASTTDSKTVYTISRADSRVDGSLAGRQRTGADRLIVSLLPASGLAFFYEFSNG